jgi:immunity protein 5 of polymorphic toxin system
MRLDERDHRTLALWAADCIVHVLRLFEKNYPEDDRPRNAVEAGRAWARGEIATSEARAAAFAAHAADYAVTAATDSTAEERDWQYRRLPEHLRPVAFPARDNA